MRSLILTLVYLCKDTLHRWLTRLSSPLARILVVFFLSLCALFFLGSYVITTKTIQDRIREQGADSINMYARSENPNASFPSESEITKVLAVESWCSRNIGYLSNDALLRTIAIITYDHNRNSQYYPLMVKGLPTLLVTPDLKVPQGFRNVETRGHRLTVHVRHLPAEHPLMRSNSGRVLLVSPKTALTFSDAKRIKSAPMQIVLRTQDETLSLEKLQQMEAYLRNYVKLEDIKGQINSAIPLIKNLNVYLSNQGQARAGFSLGIAVIVGILLTALASMEYRQNEYIYTLMKSFGIRPILLAGTFIVENIVLVAISFIAAIYTFMEGQKVVFTQFFKQGKHLLTLEEIMSEVQLIGAALLVCVLISAIPIFVAVNREIGRVLK